MARQSRRHFLGTSLASIVLSTGMSAEALTRSIDSERATRARDSLLSYGRLAVPNFETPRHIKLLAEKLEAVERGDIKRLMVFMQPRGGKSLMVTQLFPCWCLGRHPEWDIAQAGYGAPIALEHSRKARDLFVSEATEQTFPGVHHAPATEGQRAIAVARQAAHEWGTTFGGQYYAVGVGGGLTGRGADLAIIDDPVKDREEAESPVIRQRVIDWYKSVLYTRLSPNGAIVLVMTRWHPNDLAGWILAQGDEHWDVLELPAIDADNNAMWPERFPIERLEQIRATIGQREFAALYQQQPVVRGGNIFDVTKVQWEGSLDNFPDCKYVRFWDVASTEKQRAKDDPDYTAGTLYGETRTKDGLLEVWIKDSVRMQQEAPERDRRIIATTEKDGPAVQVGIESVAGYKDAYTYLRGKLRGIRSVVKVTVSKDMVVRAAPLEPVFEAGNVHILRSNWGTQMVTEFAEHPNGAHDDMLASVVGAHEMINKGALDMSAFAGFRRKAGV